MFDNLSYFNIPYQLIILLINIIKSNLFILFNTLKQTKTIKNMKLLLFTFFITYVVSRCAFQVG